MNLPELVVITVGDARWLRPFPLWPQVQPRLNLQTLRLLRLDAFEHTPLDVLVTLASCETLELHGNTLEHFARHVPTYIRPIPIRRLLVCSSGPSPADVGQQAQSPLPFKDIETLQLQQFDGWGIEVLTRTLVAFSGTSLERVVVHFSVMQSGKQFVFGGIWLGIVSSMHLLLQAKWRFARCA